MATQLRGLKNIKTMAAKANEKITPQKAYITIATLELEKQRHMQEISTLMQRLTALHTRLQQIENEQVKLSKLILGKSIESKLALSLANLKEKLNLGQAIAAKLFKIRY